MPWHYGTGFMGQGVTTVSVRAFSSVVLSLAAMTVGAQASSFVTVGAPASTPSIIKLAALEPMKAVEVKTARTASASPTPSVVALGDPLPDVTYEKVAAIPDQPKTKHGFMQNPMIIRGGIVGGAFATPAPSPTKTANAPEAPATAVPTTPMASDGKSGTKTASSKSAPQPVSTTPQPKALPGVRKAI
jgi:hypothetical protein